MKLKEIQSIASNQNYDNRGGFGGGRVRPKQVKIFYDPANQGSEDAADELIEYFDQFMRKRRFKCNPLDSPQKIRWDYEDLLGIRKEIRGSANSIFLFIISNDKKGSKSKREITRSALLEKEPECASTMNQSSHRNIHQQINRNCQIDPQFIMIDTIKNGRMKVFSLMESLVCV